MKTWQNPNQTNLPIDLLVWVVKDRIIKPSVLKTFLFLKLSHADRIEFSKCLYEDVSEGLGINIKTARAHVKELIDVKFIGLDKLTNTLYVRSKYKVIPGPHRKTLYQAIVTKEHLNHFTEFILSATISYMVRKKKTITKYRPAPINEGAQRSRYAVIKGYHGVPIALTYIGSFLGKSNSWVDKYKKMAARLRWITIKHYLKPTGIPWSNRFQYLSFYNIPIGLAKKWQGQLFLIGADILTSNIYIHKGKKV